MILNLYEAGRVCFTNCGMGTVIKKFNKHLFFQFMANVNINNFLVVSIFIGGSSNLSFCGRSTRAFLHAKLKPS